MKNKITFIFSFIIGCYTMLAMNNDEASFSSFISSIKNKDFVSARDYANNISENELKFQCKQLIDVLYYSGQKKTNIAPPKSENNKTQIIYYISKGYYFLYTNPYSTKAFEYISKAKNIVQNNDELRAYILTAILDVYNYEISQSNNDRLIYLKDFEKLINNPTDEFYYKLNLLLYNLQNVFYKLELNQEFINDFELIMENFEKGHSFWPIYYSTVGVLHEALGNLDKAINFHTKAIYLIRDEPYLKHLKFRSNIRLSEIMRREADFDKALQFIKEAENFITQTDTLKGQYYLNLYSSYIFFGLEDYKNAYKKLKKATEQNIKLDHKKNSSEISNLNVKYQTAEKEKQILIEQQKKKQNKNIAIGLGGSLALGSIIAFLLFRISKRKQKLAEQEKALETQKLATVLKEQELTSIDAMIKGQEKERQRIANDLHDDLGGLMATVKMHFNVLKEKPSSELYDKTNKLLDVAYNKIRTVAHAKNSGVMANKGLLKAVKEIARTVSASNKITVDVIDHGLENRLENSLELTIFRIIQELITNIIKHSEATEATIHITKHKESLNIMVEDNGKGFNTKKIAKTNGMGIHSIDKRIENLGGTVTIESEINKGTTVIIDIPS